MQNGGMSQQMSMGPVLRHSAPFRAFSTDDCTVQQPVMQTTMLQSAMQASASCSRSQGP
jgi:hypothetical protein